jgi:hypothetical protein
MSTGDVASYWETQKVKNGLQPPMELSNTVKAVFSVKNSISYCFAEDYKKGAAKILLKL